jgi:hypothetical protein
MRRQKSEKQIQDQDTGAAHMVIGKRNRRSFDYALARPQKRRSKILGERFAQDDKYEEVGFQ